MMEDWDAMNTRQKKMMDNQAYERFRKLLNEENVSRIWEGGLDMQEMYDKWNETLISIKKRCEVKKKKLQEGNTSKNKQVILEEYQPQKSILTESVKVKFAIKPAKTDSLSPTVVT